MKLRGVPDAPRAHEYLNMAWAKRWKQFGPLTTSFALKEDLWLDISQCVSRRGTTTGPAFGKPGTLCTSGLWYSYSEDVVLDGADFFALQGWPRTIAFNSRWTSREKRKLAAEGFNLGCFGAVLFAFYLNPKGRWW